MLKSSQFFPSLINLELLYHQQPKKYALDRKQLRQWRQQEVNIRNSDPKGFRISGGGRKLTSEEHEQKVIEQFIHLRKLILFKCSIKRAPLVSPIRDMKIPNTYRNTSNLGIHNYVLNPKSSDDDIDDLLQLNNSLNLEIDNDVVAFFD
ncbi:hypothetical protein GEMRC1_011316 [Eukaryota sp. GEM-RC1]